MSTAYFSRWSGPVKESDDPYNPDGGYSPPNLAVQKHVQEVIFLPELTDISQFDQIKSLIYQFNEAVMVSICYEESSYNAAKSAYYFSGTSNQCAGEAKKTNHAVALVGWNDNYSKSNFMTMPPGNGAFIVRNSWGTTWGEQGYFYVSYYDTRVGLNAVAFNNAESVSNYKYVYQHDPLGWTNIIGYGSDTAYMANIFKASNKPYEALRACSFYTVGPDMDYAIDVYRNISDTDNPISGNKYGTITGSFVLPGYHTVSLAPLNVTVNNGENFSVVVKLTTTGDVYPLPIEERINGFTDDAVANGAGFASHDGIHWDQIVEHPECSDECVTNVNLKAFTDEFIQDGGTPDGSTDAGQKDGGFDAGKDSGMTDAGYDSGMADSGHDGGMPYDSGLYDASVDANVQDSGIDSGIDSGVDSGFDGACERKACSDGYKRCKGDIIQTCSQDNCSWVNGTVCQYGCYYGTCNQPNSPDGGIVTDAGVKDDGVEDAEVADGGNEPPPVGCSCSVMQY